MLLRPKLTKYKKYHKGRICLKPINTSKRTQLLNGSYGIKVLEAGRITPKHLETVRRFIKRVVKRSGKLWINIFPHLPVTAKPNENRMGKGKGKVEYYTCLVKPGDVIVELAGVNNKISLKILESSIKKLPVICQIIKVI